jgi:hypothetical protein
VGRANSANDSSHAEPLTHRARNKNQPNNAPRVARSRNRILREFIRCPHRYPCHMPGCSWNLHG